MSKLKSNLKLLSKAVIARPFFGLSNPVLRTEIASSPAYGVLLAMTMVILLFLCLTFKPLWAEEVLGWKDCLLEAQKHHPDLISAKENITQQKAAKSITASTLYPQVDAQLSASTQKTSSDSGGSTSSSTQDSYTYGVTANQLIFDGLTTVNNVKAATETIKSSQQNYFSVSSGIRLALRTAFVNLLRAQELVKVSEEIVKIRRDDYELITLRYESGLEHKGSLLNAEADLAQAYFQLAQAKRDIELAQRQLTKEMGREEFKPMRVMGDFKVSDSAKIKPDLEKIAKTNPSLLLLTAKKNAAAFSLKSTYGNFFPQLTGNAGANKSSSHWPPNGDQWNLGLNLSLPVFEGGLRIAQVRQAKALYDQADQNERSTKDAVIVALAQTWTNLQDAIESVGVQNKQLIASQERSKIAEAEFSTGFITYDNWTIIEDNLVSAKTAYLNAQAGALLAEANWIQAKGETLEYAQN